MTEQALLCGVEIYIKINTYWLAIKFIPLSPELFSLVLLPFLIPNDCLSAQWGFFRSFEISSPLDFASTPQQLMNPPVTRIRQGMSDSISNPNLLTGSGWRKKRKADEKGNLARGLCRESKILACRQRLICVCIFSEACIMALTLSLLIVTISGKPPC